MSSFVRYTANGSQTTFPITFPYLRVEHVFVYVNGVQTSWTESNGSAVLNTAPAAASEVIIRRKTPASPILVNFSYDNQTSPFALNEAYRQALFAAEDTFETVENLNLTLGADQVPLAAAADRLLVSRPIAGGFQWQAVEINEVLPLLSSIPAATAGFKLLGTDADTASYRFYDLSELVALLGGGSGSGGSSGGTVPAPDQPSRVLMTNAAGDAYVLTSLASLASQLGLGTAAKKNVGTAQGQIPELGPPIGGVGTMPAVHVGDMIGVGKEHDYALWERIPGTPVALGSGTTVNFLESGSLVQGPNTSGWIAPASGSPTPGPLLQAGSYRVDLEVQTGTTSTTTDAVRALNLIFTPGTAVQPSSPIASLPVKFRGNSTEYFSHRLTYYFRLTGPEALSLRLASGMTSGATLQSLRAHIWKLA